MKQQEKDFKPTSKMQKYLDTAIRILSDSPSEIASNCEVSRESWYYWKDIEGFEDWFYKTYKKERRKIVPQLDELGLKYAKKGSFAHWKAMNQKVGELLKYRENSININVQNVIQTQKEKYAL